MKRRLLFTFLIMGSVLYAQQHDSVSLELAKTAAIQHAQLKYEKASFYSVTPYYDMEGDIAVYCVVLKKEKGRDLPESQLIEDLQKSNQRVQELRSELASTELPEDKQDEIRREIDKAEKEASFEGDYITVLTGTSIKQVPVLMSYEGIPQHLRMKHEAEELLHQQNESQQLGPVFYFGLFDVFYGLKPAGNPAASTFLQDLDEVKDITIPQHLLNPVGGEIMTLDEIREQVERAELQSLKKSTGTYLTDELEEREQKLARQWEAISSLHKRESGIVEVVKSKEAYAGEVFEKKQPAISSSPMFKEPQLSSEYQVTILDTLEKEVLKDPPKTIIQDNEYLISKNLKSTAAEAGMYTLFSESFSGAYPGAWDVGWDPGFVGGRMWAWPNGYAYCYSDGITEYYYPNNLITWMDLRNVDFTIPGMTNTELEFSVLVDTEEVFDFFMVRVRDQYGTWHERYRDSGEHDAIETVTLDLSEFEGQSDLYIGFYFESDGTICGQTNNEYNGVYLDDIRISYDIATQLPELAALAPESWDGPVVVSFEPGTHTNSGVFQGSPAYIDFSWQNNNDGATSDACRHYVYVDDVLELIIEADPLIQYRYDSYDDWTFTFTETGYHTIRLVLDAEGDVNEINENNNVFERQVLVEGNTQRVIEEVPDYEQRDYRNMIGGISVATCLADIMGYWDRVKYWNLVDNGTAPLIDTYTAGNVEETVEWFRSRYYFQGPPTGATKVALLEEYMNDLNGLDFTIRLLSVNDYTVEHLFRFVENEIIGFDGYGAPVAWDVSSFQTGGSHFMPIIGYQTGGSGSFVRVILNQGFIQAPAWVNWYGYDSYNAGCNEVILIEPGGTSVDDYEPDNDMTLQAATTIYPVEQPGPHLYTFRQTHDFHHLNDFDYIKFYAERGSTYTINTKNLGEDADTYMRLLENTGGTTRVLGYSDDDGEGVGSRIIWTCTDDSNNPFYLEIQDYDNQWGPNSYYDLEITVEGGTAPPNPVYGPAPANGATNVEIDPILNWVDGGGATSFDVYFGIDPTPDAGEFVGNQASSTYLPGTLSFNTTYYWKIDAVNSSGTTPGPVWHFTTEADNQSYLNVTPDQFLLGYPAGSSENFSITSNVNWTISDIPSWLSITPGSGSGNETILATANTANPSSIDIRTVDIRVIGNNVPEEIVTINQDISPPSQVSYISPANGATGISFDPTLTWSESEGAITYEVYFGTDATPDGGEYIGSQTGLSYEPPTLAENTTYYWKIDAVNSSGTTTGPTWHFTTTAGTQPNLSVSPSYLALDAEAGSYGSFTITSNVGWNITGIPSWLTVTPSSGTGNWPVLVTADTENTAAESRSGIITVSGGGLSEDVNIEQAGSDPFLDLSTTEVTLTSGNGASISVDVYSNINWIAVDNEDWISVDPESGSDNGTIVISTSSENTTGAIRTGSVSVSGANKARSLTVHQEFVVSAPGTSINDTGFSVYPNPASNKIFVHSSKDVFSSSLLHIYDATGKLMISLNIEEMYANTPLELDVSGFTSGIYILKLTGSESNAIKTLIIE